MACFHPLTAFQCSDGSIVFNNHRRDTVRNLQLPCGQCVGCRLERSRQWAIRCMHEASLYRNNCFITLTYNDDFLPSDKSLHYEDFQKFMKRLRKSHRGIEPSANPEVKGNPIRFYMCGEYGENFGRPHFHACLFNFDFSDKHYWQTTKSGSKVFRSDTLEALWSDPVTGRSLGFSSIGSVNFESAAYVARYIMKKVTGQCSDLHYSTKLDESTGELIPVIPRTPEFNKMSLKPGIGYDWFQRYKSDVYPHDYVVVRGKKCKPPKYYDKKMLDEDFDLMEGHVLYQRHLDAISRSADNTPERLAVKETCANARLSKLPRGLK